LGSGGGKWYSRRERIVCKPTKIPIARTIAAAAISTIHREGSKSKAAPASGMIARDRTQALAVCKSFMARGSEGISPFGLALASQSATWSATYTGT
jgi:hypothetical protein